MACEETKSGFARALHNLSEELDGKKITFQGLVPSVWVEYYRKPRQLKPRVARPKTSEAISTHDFEAICANSTGIDIIDEVTRDMPLEWRSDVRQEAALICLERGLGNLSEDEIVQAVRFVTKQSKKVWFDKKYKEVSLFSKHDEDGRELWETLVAPEQYNPEFMIGGEPCATTIGSTTRSRGR